MSENKMHGSNMKRIIEILVISILVIICLVVAFFLYRPRTGSSIAIITVDSVEYMRIDLETSDDRIFSILDETGKPVEFEIKEHKIRFINVICPDHICEKAGWCELPGQRAVCLPNRTALICYAENEV